MRKPKVKEVACEPLKITPCCRKKSYPSFEEADAARKRTMSKNYRNESRRGHMHAYYCTSCDGWHVGHVKPAWKKK